MIDRTMMALNKEKTLRLFLTLVGVVGGAFAFSLSYFSNTNVLIGLCLLPFCIFITGVNRNNLLYAGLFVVFALMAFSYGVRIFYYFALAFYFLWLVELFLGRANILIMFLVVFMSPFFVQLVTILGFPLRLMLSAHAGTLLNMVGVNVRVDGNMMIIDSGTFSVDEACMGLNMLVISMLMGVFVLAYRYRTSGTALGVLATTIFFVVVFILNIITNVMRIITLVYFRVAPENPMHEFIGILCLVAYVVIPLHLFSAWVVQKYGTVRTEQQAKPVFNRMSMLLMAIFPLVVLGVGCSIERSRQASPNTHATVQFGNASSEKLSDGITKISSDDLLIYVKTIPEFFTGEHTPLMCWKGSGYDFSGVTTQTIEGVTIYKGVLVNDDSQLYTAWWYSNGKIQTVSQFDWRMRMLKGEDRFCLVNVTSKNEKTLVDSITSMFTTTPIIIKT